jgi:hypothetical protein
VILANPAGIFSNAASGWVIATNNGAFVLQTGGVINQGTMLASNGAALLLNGPVSGTGVFNAGAGATLGFGNGGSLNFATSVFFTGATLIVQGALTNSQAGDLNSVGTLVITNGSLFNASYGNLILGPNGGDVGALTIANAGSLAVTNTAGTATLVVGQSGKGVLTLNSGSSLAVNQLLVTNNTVTTTNSVFAFNGGRMTTSNAFLAANVVIASNATLNVNGTWNMLGGSNIVSGLSTSNGSPGLVVIGNAASGAAVTVGPGAVLSFNNPGALTTYSNVNLTIGSGVATGNGLTVNGGTVINAGVVIIGSGGAGSPGNSLTISNGGSFYSGNVILGNIGGATGNSYNIGGVGAGSTVSNGTITVGSIAGFNTMTVTNAQLTSSTLSVGSQSQASNNLVSVFANSTWNLQGGNVTVGGAGLQTSGNTLLIQGGVVTNGNTINVGSQSADNTLLVQGGGQLFAVALDLGQNAGASNNLVLIQSGGLVSVGASGITVGSGATGAASNVVVVNGGTLVSASSLQFGHIAGVNNDGMVISNGGTYFGGNTLVGQVSGSANNFYDIGGLGLASTVSNGTITVGDNAGAGSNSMTVTNAQLLSGALTIGSGGSNNTVAVLPGATWNLLGSSVTIGSAAAAGNTLTVNNGVVTNAGVVTVGSGAGAVNNSLTITNNGQLDATKLIVGNSNNSVVVSSGGLLEANTLSNFIGGVGNTINNSGGIYQFTTNTPAIVPNGFGNITITNGTISFRAIANADVYSDQGGTGHTLTNISFMGNNTFMLNAASNTTAGQTYTFDSVANTGQATNYQALVMVNGATAFRGGNLTIGSGGSFLASNTVATITGLFTNNGVAAVVNSTANFNNGVVNGGVFTLSGSTVLGAVSNLTLGTLQGIGLFSNSVVNAGTISPGWLSPGSLSITGNLTLAGSSLVLLGLAESNSFDQINVSGALSRNGTLTVTNLTGFTLAAGDSFQLLDFGSSSGSFVVTNLPSLPGGLQWDTLQLDSQGLLSVIVIPEPSTVVLVVVGMGLMMCIRARRRW